MALNSIAHEWQAFAKMVFAGTQPCQTQIDEMRKAFYAGAYTLVCAINEIGEPHVSEQQGVVYLETIRDECERFYRGIMAQYSERN